MSNDILNVQHLTKLFSLNAYWLSGAPSSFKAVDNVSFSLKEGEILGLLGPNGAGKTTTIQMLLGVLTPTEGTIHFFGKNLFKHRSKILEKVSHVSAYTKLPGSLTIEENLFIYAGLYGVSSAEASKRIEKLLETFGIGYLRKRFANTLSAGQTTRVMLVKAFIPYPKVVLLDEPTASLDPDIAAETRQFIVQQQREYGVSMILTSHNMLEVAEICNRLLVLRQGKIVAEDTPTQLARSVASTNMLLHIASGIEQALQYLNVHQIQYQVNQHILLIQLDESEIPRLLIQFAKLDIHYVHLDIRKPNLEDYFLYLARNDS